MLGGAVGTVVQNVWPVATAGAGAYALVGMGAVVAAGTHAPITAILIIFELTADYKLILPLMAACIISTLITTRLMHGSIYTTKLLRRGLDIRRGQDLNLLKSLRVRDVMSEDVAMVGENESLGSLLAAIAGTRHQTLYVVDDEGRFIGAVDPPELRDAASHAGVLAELLVARELAIEGAPTAAPEQSLDVVSRVFKGRSVFELPVVDEDGRLLGVVSRGHLIEAYNQELLKRDMVAGIAGDIAASAQEEITVGEGYKLAEIDAPGLFLDRTIGELEIRKRFSVEVLLLRRRTGATTETTVELVPGVETVIRRGDRLVVLGTSAALRRLRAL
jgi:CIC family chloride channel protein